MLTGHREMMRPEQPWESTKIGAGAPPVRVREGWLLTYHGVGPDGSGGQIYRAGAALLDRDDPTIVRDRTAEPLLSPDLAEERIGTVGKIRINGSENAFDPVSTTSSGTTLYVGANSSGTANANARIKEIAILNGGFAEYEFTWLRQYATRVHSVTL